MQERRALLSISRAFVATMIMVWSGGASQAAIYQVTVNTSSLAGTAGNVDFQFNPGGGSTQPGLVTISSFSGGTVVGTASTFGGVAGNLPATVTIDNSGGLNDYFQAFTFGNSFSFALQFSGPDVNAPNGTATSGSAFGLSLYNAGGDTPLLTNNADGFIATANVNLDGTVTISTYPSSGAGSAPVATIVSTSTPEPTTLTLFAAPLLAVGGLALRRRRS